MAAGFVETDYHALTPEQQQVVEAARQALATAYAPYSDFLVGAALLLQDGSLISGSNQENAAYPSGICAERAALFAYGSRTTRAPITKLAVVAQKRHHNEPAVSAPCGACRQVMLEYELLQQSPFEVIFYYDNKYLVATSARELLPYYFQL
ncbi:MAG TPA: cytidine deaminase [Flammeovirgaceae bacterium]|nr:cytidine deaminase [Flammeovirgaceae bacterium]